MGEEKEVGAEMKKEYVNSNGRKSGWRTGGSGALYRQKIREGNRA